MTFWIIIGAIVAIAFLVAGQKAADQKRERDTAREAASAARAKAMREAAEREKADAQAAFDAITLPRRARWAAWDAEAKRLTAEARANPPQDLHRIVWEPSTHRYKVMRWWVAGGKAICFVNDDDDVGGDYLIQPRKVGSSVEYEEMLALVELRAVAQGDDRADYYRSYRDLNYLDRAEPPAEAKALQGYKVVTEKRFDTVREAEHWLFLDLHPDETQRGYNADGQHVTDEVVPLPRPTIPGLPSLILGSASAVVDDSDVDLTEDEAPAVGGEFVTHRLLGRSRNRLSTRYKDL